MRAKESPNRITEQVFELASVSKEASRKFILKNTRVQVEYMYSLYDGSEQTGT
jgi:hypothetical protein